MPADLGHIGEDEAAALSANTAQPNLTPKARSTSSTSSAPSISGSDDDRWTISAKKKRPRTNRPPSIKLKSHTIRIPNFVDAGPEASTSSLETDGRPKRWLALGLAGMVYVVGIVGLWSMVRTFDQPSPLSLTPAGDEEILPPLDDRIDVRDAALDGPIRPEFRPEVDSGISDDIAASDLQKKI